MQALIRIVIAVSIGLGMLGVAIPFATAQNEAQKKALQEKCKAASFARRPAGTMATSMRDDEIKRCIKAGGQLC